MSRNGTIDALTYHEPGPVSILTLTSFFLLLNLINYVMDRLFYAGLLGYVFLGIAWGTPGLKWLEPDTEAVCVKLGYLGLLLLVYEGGLSTSFRSLIANFLLSLTVATTGIILPIAFSFILIVLARATPLQAFSAGAALCSTSLGTTFTVMQSSGLRNTRIGAALTVAAMIDDVVGLIMVQVISKLGSTSNAFGALTIVRPILVSVALGFSLLVACRFFVLPLTIWLNKRRVKDPNSLLSKLLILKEAAFILHTLFLVGMVASATYAGTSNLFAAYLTGTAISWWDVEVPHYRAVPRSSIYGSHNEISPGTKIAPPAPIASIGLSSDQIESEPSHDTHSNCKRDKNDLLNRVSGHIQQSTGLDRKKISGLIIFRTYYNQPLQRVLKPLFFASIGFAIPIRHIFAGTVVWRGIIYTILMIFSKMACGLWLIRIPLPIWLLQIFPRKPKLRQTKSKSSSPRTKANQRGDGKGDPNPQHTRSTQQVNSLELHTAEELSHHTARPMKPVSIYPGAIMSCAMVARGEVGLLISSLAEADGIFGEQPNGPIFLIITWAILLCTIVGPLFVGIISRRLRVISKKKFDNGEGRQDTLGVWGVDETSIREDK